jgi:spermidine synthase
MKVLTEGEEDDREFRVLERIADGSRLYYESGVLYTHVDAAGANLLDYVTAMEAALGEPASLLLLGTAGGALATAFSRRGARVTAVDDWQAAFDIAHRWFQLPATVDCVRSDAVAFLRSTSGQWDAIAVDVFRGTQIPPVFLTSEMGALLAGVLKPGGIVVWNVADSLASWSAQCVARTLRLAGLATKMVSVIDRDAGNTLVVGRDRHGR